MWKIAIEEVMDKLNMSRSRFGEIDEFGWWDLERVSADEGTEFTSAEFKQECKTGRVHLTLAAPEHQEINGQVEVICRTLCTISHSLLVHARFLGVYINFASMYTTGHIFLVLPIKYMINKDGDLTAKFKLATGTKYSVSHLRVLFFPCVVRKATTYFGIKALNMRHQAQKGFSGILVGIKQHQKGYLVYVPNSRKIISLYDVVFGESFPSVFYIYHNLIQKHW